MSFNIAVSGLRAASADLEVTGNNIANAGTTGFKGSRTEFADVYAVSNLGTTRDPIGAGVRLAAVSQQFGQGNVNFTDNSLDLAVSGQGFFVLSGNGAQAYTRSGAEMSASSRSMVSAWTSPDVSRSPGCRRRVSFPSGVSR